MSGFQRRRVRARSDAATAPLPPYSPLPLLSISISIRSQLRTSPRAAISLLKTWKPSLPLRNVNNSKSVFLFFIQHALPVCLPIMYLFFPSILSLHFLSFLLASTLFSLRRLLCTFEAVLPASLHLRLRALLMHKLACCLWLIHEQKWEGGWWGWWCGG